MGGEPAPPKVGIKGQAVLGKIQDQVAKRRGQKEIQVSQKELSSGVNKEVPGQCPCAPITGKPLSRGPSPTNFLSPPQPPTLTPTDGGHTG